MTVIRAGIHKMLVRISVREDNVSDCSLQGLQVRSWPGTILSWRFDHEIISTAILPSADSRRVFVKY